jgi:hypothetical protein
VQLALKNVIDITESDIMALLKLAIDAHRRRDPNSMEVDAAPAASSTAIPPLSTILAACIDYPTSPAALRVAFRQHLRDAEDVIAIMGVLENWITAWHEQPSQLGPVTGDVRKNEQGIFVVQTLSSSTPETPDIDKVSIISNRKHTFELTHCVRRRQASCSV